MAFELTRDDEQFSLPAASVVLPRTAVKLAGTSVLFVLPCGSVNDEPFGTVKATAGASGLNQGERVAIYEHANYVKMIAGASLGVGADVGVGSSNGVMKPIVAATGSIIWRVGKSITPAAAGDVFTVYVSPKQLDSQF